MRKFLLAVILVCVGFLLSDYYTKYGTSVSGVNEIINPLEYVKVTPTGGRIRILKKQFNLTGSVRNESQSTIFKDFELAIKFISKTGTEMGQSKYTIYEIAAPGQRVDFDINVDIPAGIDKWQINDLQYQLVTATVL